MTRLCAPRAACTGSWSLSNAWSKAKESVNKLVNKDESAPAPEGKVLGLGSQGAHHALRRISVAVWPVVVRPAADAGGCCHLRRFTVCCAVLCCRLQMGSVRQAATLVCADAAARADGEQEEEDDAALPPSPYEMEDEGWTDPHDPDYQTFDGEQASVCGTTKKQTMKQPTSFPKQHMTQ